MSLFDKVGDVREVNGVKYKAVANDNNKGCTGCVGDDCDCHNLLKASVIGCGRGFILKEVEVFTKADLQDGDVVTLRKCHYGTRTFNKGDFIKPDGSSGVDIDNYGDDLADRYGDSDFDIIKVERTTTEVLFEREPEPDVEITVKINGEIAKLSDISAETLAKIKELEE